MWHIKILRFRKENRISKALGDKAFEIASNRKYDAYQTGLASMVSKIFDKKSSGSGVTSNQQLENEIHKPIIRKIKRRKLYFSFKDNI